MKRLFFICTIVLCSILGTSAQTLFYEGFEDGVLPAGWTVIDADGDGYNWDATYLYLSGTAHSVDGMIASASYINDVGVLSPDNWLITPAISLTSNCSLSFWVRAQDSSWPAEHYGVYISTTGTDPADFSLLFEETLDANSGAKTSSPWKQKTVNLSSYSGQTVYIAFRHFNCTDMFWLDLDDVEIFVMSSDPSITVTPNTLDFGSVILSDESVKIVVVGGYNLTSQIAITTSAPFAVSTDGVNYASIDTISAIGGVLYVRYAPTSTNGDNGIITLSSIGATDVTVALTGTAIECSNMSISYSYSFDNEYLFNCWQIIDANTDGYTFSYGM